MASARNMRFADAMQKPRKSQARGMALHGALPQDELRKGDRMISKAA